MKTKLIRTKAKEIFTKSKLPGCDWAINQYVGCDHACLYCYAKFISRWRPPDYGKWGGWVEAKMNAPELVSGRHVDGWVYMSSISDPYQSVEKELELTRKVLENLDKTIKISIQTTHKLIRIIIGKATIHQGQGQRKRIPLDIRLIIAQWMPSTYLVLPFLTH